MVKLLRDEVSLFGINNTLLMTDEYKAYNALDEIFSRSVINFTVRYADGITQFNTIEVFWSLLKRTWYSSHHHYETNYTPLYLTEACWKYNNRKYESAFRTFFRGFFQ